MTERYIESLIADLRESAGDMRVMGTGARAPLYLLNLARARLEEAASALESQAERVANLEAELDAANKECAARAAEVVRLKWYEEMHAEMLKHIKSDGVLTIIAEAEEKP